jgi:condensin-2 complex subunit H2
LLSDLAKNWNIDIAHELEDYLAELSAIEISFDGGHTNLNFAEAALLIQGSACIYSKKVE